MDSFEIGNRRIGPEEPTFIIAEAGSNHNGNLDTAKELIDAAAEAGADAVKFQTYRAEKMYAENADLKLLDSDKTAFELFNSLEMPYEWIDILFEYAHSQGLYFMSTPFDEESADELTDYVPAFKVASSLLVHHPFLKYLAKKDKPIILSTGAKSLDEIEKAVEAIRTAGDIPLALLQCTTAYPTPLEQANVRVIRTFQNEFGVPTGLSDHTTEPEIAPAAAVALDATIIEKHFTLDKNMAGPDHTFSMEPDEFQTLVTKVRKTESVLGSSEKCILDIEKETPTGEPCLHACEQLSAGEQINEKNTVFVRPADDECVLPPSKFENVVGRKLKNSVKPGDKIGPEDLV